jgi:Protein of unknown function (DUF3455)
MNTLLKVLLNAVSLTIVWLVALAIVLLVARVSAQVPSAIAVADGTAIVTLRAEGAQIYQCKPDSDGKSLSQKSALTWQFREPIATLILDVKSVGRHYAGPNWDYIDGSGAKGKVAASAPGARPDDISWLKLDVVDRRGDGVLSSATTVQRINTTGGAARGPCENEGDYRSVPYSADYVFLRKRD